MCLSWTSHAEVPASAVLLRCYFLDFNSAKKAMKRNQNTSPRYFVLWCRTFLKYRILPCADCKGTVLSTYFILNNIRFFTQQLDGTGNNLRCCRRTQQSCLIQLWTCAYLFIQNLYWHRYTVLSWYNPVYRDCWCFCAYSTVLWKLHLQDGQSQKKTLRHQLKSNVARGQELQGEVS